MMQKIKQIFQTMSPKTKYILIAAAALVLCLVIVICAVVISGGKNDVPSDGTDASTGVQTTYTVTVQGRNGEALSGVEVYLYADGSLEDLIMFAQTDAAGKATFTEAASEHYVVVLKNVPAEYEVAESYALTGETTAIVLMGSPAPSESEPTEPNQSEPTEPDESEPSEPTESQPTDPTGSEPTDPTETQPTTPAPTDPTPTDPAPTDPAPTNPEPTTPTPAEPIHINKDDPIDTGAPFDAEVAAGTVVYYNVYKLSGPVTLQIKDANAYFIYNGKTYMPSNGVVSLSITPEGPFSPILLAIGNAGTADATFTVNAVYPAGTYNNPITLKMGEITVKQSKDNDQGVYYTYKATQSGTLTLELISITPETDCNIVVDNLTTYGPQLQLRDPDDPDATILTIPVNAGDTLRIIFSAGENNDYPAATMVVVASFA